MKAVRCALLLWGGVLLNGAADAMAAEAAEAAVATVAPKEAAFKVLRPATAADGSAIQTTQAFTHILGQAEASATVQVAGQPAALFSTGIFARDNVALQMGPNRITVSARLASGAWLETHVDVERIAPPAPPQWPARALFINGARLWPQHLHRLAPGDTVDVQVQATPGQWVQARLAAPAALQPGLQPGLPPEPWVTLEETTNPGHYRARLGFGHARDVDPQPVQIRVQGRPAPGASASSNDAIKHGRYVRSARVHTIHTLTPGHVGQWAAVPERLYVAGAEGANLLHGLHDVRLGGPYMAELPPGTLLQARALQGTDSGDHLQVQLSPDTQAWVPLRALAPAPAGTARPQVHFTNVSLQGSAAGDVLQIPLTAAVPYTVQWVQHGPNTPTLDVLLYGAHHATTWITHRHSAGLVQEVSAEQARADVVRVRLELQAHQVWGWWAERVAGALRVHVLPKPTLNADAPLQGLRIALEPGHGGPINRGAVGATGVPEKDINRWTVEALQAELQTAGAQVVLTREGDSNPSQRERVRLALAGGAQLFLSVHGNAADTSRGALRVGGTSSYYKHANGRALAAAVHARMLQLPGLADFGLVGNFNYAPLRLLTQMPAALLELAFLTHPGDEALLLDAAFRSQIARAVRQGLEDFLRAQSKTEPLPAPLQPEPKP